MKTFIQQIIMYVMGYQPPTSAAEDVATVLSSFDNVVVALDEAIVKAEEEIDGSFDRQDAAYVAWSETRDTERATRGAAMLAMDRAETVRDRIAALVS